MSAVAIHPGYPLFTRTVNTGYSQESRDLQNKVASAFHQFRKRADREQAFDDLAQALQQARW